LFIIFVIFITRLLEHCRHSRPHRGGQNMYCVHHKNKKTLNVLGFSVLFINMRFSSRERNSEMVEFGAIICCMFVSVLCKLWYDHFLLSLYFYTGVRGVQCPFTKEYDAIFTVGPLCYFIYLLFDIYIYIYIYSDFSLKIIWAWRQLLCKMKMKITSS